ncbi:helix-turn-helix domain-containing protein [Paraferrimonas sp. SM1919]|uniref:helix-turn-helix domain-containing protein n=1 Tax=Paraferrimonas sp. SM1919 TaxID=2662263 RepID=UPI0013D540C0|nr:helix-turn-helix transcriptional regulator [Paraferrimonas sp. SM1919]
MQTAQKLIGLNVKIERTRKGWNQSELAHKLGVEQSYVSKVERGEIAASCERVYEIIQVLGCEHTDIFPDVSELTG